MTSTLEHNALTHDAFLGGQLSIWQPKQGYRAGADPVLLAAAADAKPGQSVLELGCGVGVALLCLQRRVGGLTAVGIEIQPDYAVLAGRNAADNDLPLRVVTGDLANMPPVLRTQSFDLVIANPPYFDRNAGPTAGNAGREVSRGVNTPLKAWVEAGIRRLVPGGTLTIIDKPDRLPNVLSACDARVGSLRILPLAPRKGTDANQVIIQAQKGAKGALRLLSPLILHRGDRHDIDGDSYTDELRSILRGGAALQMG